MKKIKKKGEFDEFEKKILVAQEQWEQKDGLNKPAITPSELITMSSEAYAEEMRRVVPGLLHIIEDAVKEGRPIQAKVKRASAVTSKDDNLEGVPEDGRSHVIQSQFMEIKFIVDTGKQVVSP